MEECGKSTKKESPIDLRLERLVNRITKLKAETLPKFEPILASVLMEPEKSDAPEGTRAAGQTSLEERLILMYEDVQKIDEYLVLLQNRIQL